MNLKNLKIDLLKNWREISRSGSENQFYIKIYHIHPLSKVDPKIRQDQSLPSPGPNVTVTKVGVPTPSSPPLKEFYEMMKGAISVGYLPGWTLQKLDKLYKELTEGYYPGEGDFSGDFSIVQHQTEEIARQSFKNMALMPTRGFDIPIPGGVHLPGLPKDVTFTELLESEAYEKFVSQYIPKEQLETLRSALKEIQEKQIPQVRKSFEKSGVKYKEGKYLGCDVIYVESKNLTPPPKPKSSSLKTSGIGGGGFDDRLDPLPKISQPYQKKIVIYQAMLLKNFIISGSLLWAVSSLLAANTPCYSLTRSKKKTRVTREGGEVFTDISIVPLASSYAQEGYLHKEEIEKIIKSVIFSLAQL